MKKNLKGALLSVIFVCFGANFIIAQSPGCPSVTITDESGLADANNVIHLDCSNSCVDLISTPFQVGTTNSYTVSSISSTPPIPYNQPGGTPISVNTDDVWSPVVSLPFNFCFYGQTYTQCQISSNGSIKMGNQYASGSNAPWSISGNLPNASLSQQGDIFGVLHDINPSITSTNPSIKWYLVGQYPCRMLCVVYKDVAHFSCTNLTSTFMMVLYETTNAIDVYVDSKPTCTSWNSGQAIIGIQKPGTSNQGVVAPGRNATPTWTVTTPEAWRFLPSGTAVYNANWYANGALVSTGDTINVCPSDSTVYSASVEYTRCDGTTIIATDSMTVIPPLTAPKITATMSSPACGSGTGQIILNVTGGVPPYQYSSDNVNYSNNNTFSNLGFGNFTFYAKGADGCTANILVSFQATPPVTIKQDSLINVKCFGDSTGRIKVSTTGGVGGYTYSLDNGPSQTLGTFDNLVAGNYSIIVKDGNGCADTLSFTITEPTKIITTPTVIPVTCYGKSDGAIMMSVTGGVTPYSYNIDGNNVFASTMPNLPGGDHIITIKDANGCLKIDTINIAGSSAQLLVSINGKDTVCAGQINNYSAVITGGTGGIQYQWSNGSTSNNTSSIFNNDSIIIVTVSDAQGCSDSDTINITAIQSPIASVTPKNSEGYPNLNVNFINGSSGANNYLWNFGDGSILTDNSNNSHQHIFTTPGNYTVILTASNSGCNINDSAYVLINPFPDPIVKVPNVFTPNGDNVNDLWKIEFDNVAENTMVYILNRWGNVVAKLEGKSAAWNGESKSKEASDGVYFYKYEIYDLNGGKHQGSGSFTLTR